MPVNDKIHHYRSFAHPLAQIRAASEFHGFSSAFVSDEWEALFTDAAPDEEDVPFPVQVLDALRQTGLRFEKFGLLDDDEDGYWDLEFGGTELDVLLYGWAHQAMDALALESRVFWHGLYGTELIFVPDYEKVVDPALQLLLGVQHKILATGRREDEDQNRIKGLYRRQEPLSKPEKP